VISTLRRLEAGLHAGLAIESDRDLRGALTVAAAAADAQGFDQPRAERVRIVATEMAANLVRHGRSGWIYFRLLGSGAEGGVELVATDHGPGMDGSTIEAIGRMGRPTDPEVTGGLAAISRASDLFDIYVAPGHGTVMMSRQWGRLTPASEGRFLVGSMLEPIPGEDVTGDAWAVEWRGAGVVALVADGLGHGAAAAAAAAAATKAFRERHQESVETIAAHIHRALQGTRGAAIAVAEVDVAQGRLRFCGIGNISARMLSAEPDRYLISHFGIAGYQSPRIRAYERDWTEGAVLVMHSDGLGPTWALHAYSGLLGNHPQLVAATVMRDAPRARDDAVVLALRAADDEEGATTPSGVSS